MGGLGGFGLELADWLVNKDARKIILVSRSGVTNGYQNLQISRWKSAGVEVLVYKSNIESEKEVLTLFQECSQLGPIGGIFNLAMVGQTNSLSKQFIEENLSYKLYLNAES